MERDCFIILKKECGKKAFGVMANGLDGLTNKIRLINNFDLNLNMKIL